MFQQQRPFQCQGNEIMNLIAVSKGLNGAHYILVNTDGTFVIWVLQAAAETKSEPSIASGLMFVDREPTPGTRLVSNLPAQC